MPSRFGRRHFLGGAATVAAAGALGAFPRLAEADGRAVRAERVTFLVPGLDPAHDGLRVAQLSDVHVGPRTPAETVRGAVELANAFEPDLVVLTGDYVCRDRREVGLVRELLGGLEGPAFAVLGNHDVWVDPEGTADALRACGYEVLENAWTEVSLRGAPLRLVGVGDRMTGRDDVERAVRGLPSGGSSPLVLAHGPRTAERVRALDRPALCLSGHTHGGQINLPIVTPILFAAIHEPYVRGRYRLGDVQLYVNRGVGMSGVRVRVNAPPEVTLATLRPA
ncbi:MAG: metallophosphoesterase [Anaeromyxobacter sp.]